jgi:hypothetical protein
MGGSRIASGASSDAVVALRKVLLWRRWAVDEIIRGRGYSLGLFAPPGTCLHDWLADPRSSDIFVS